MRRYFVPLSCVLLIACERASDAETLALECVSVAENGLVHTELTRMGLMNALGVPDTVEWSVMQTADSEDSLFVVRYPGLVVSLHKPAGATEIVDQVRVTDNQHLRFPDAGIGVAADDLRQRLADHVPVDADNQLIFNCHSHPANDNPVAFRLRADTVVEIIYTYYMD